MILLYWNNEIIKFINQMNFEFIFKIKIIFKCFLLIFVEIIINVNVLKINKIEIKIIRLIIIIIKKKFIKKLIRINE